MFVKPVITPDPPTRISEEMTKLATSAANMNAAWPSFPNRTLATCKKLKQTVKFHRDNSIKEVILR